MRLPNLLIVGAQKCGTTWLHSCLRKSAHVFGSETKELNFFNKPRFAENIDAYAKNFPEKPGATFYLESTPHYFRLPHRKRDIATGIRNTLNDPKIIVILRNPVDRYESAVIHHMMKGRLPYEDAIDWVRDDLRLISLGRYAEILAHWQTVFPGIGVFFHDDIVNDPMSFVDSVFGFLGVPNDLTVSDIDFRTNDKENKFGKIKVIQMQTNAASPSGSDPARPSWTSIPRMTERVRGELLEVFLPDIEALEGLTGRDLTSWKQIPATL